MIRGRGGSAGATFAAKKAQNSGPKRSACVATMRWRSWSSVPPPISWWVGISVVDRTAGAAGGHHQLPADCPGLVRGEEGGDVRDLGRVDHAADGVAARGVGREVALLRLLGPDAELLRPRREQARRALG